MTGIARRDLLKGPAGLLAASALAKPALARGQTLTIWWNQGYYPAEDAALRNLVAAWERQSGNRVNLTLLPGQALNKKITSALASGEVPDVMYADDAPAQIVPQNAWKGRLVDVSDVVETVKSILSPTAIESSQFYNAVEKKRAFYGVPYKGATLNLPAWRSLIEKAGYRVNELPKRWDDFFNTFKPIQRKLRKLGMSHTYGLGYTVSTIGGDPNNLFNQFLVAYGGRNIVTPQGQLNVRDPKVRKAVIDTINAEAIPFKEGYVPAGALKWGDPDNNKAFHAKEVVMSPNDTISISVAVMNNRKWYYDDIVGLELPLDNEGRHVPALLGVELAFIPARAKNIGAAKDFLRYLVQPAHLDNCLKQAQGRWLPVIPQIVHNDPYWLDPRDPHRPPAVRQGVLEPTLTWFYVFNPAYAQVNAEHVFPAAISDVINGMEVNQAVDKAFTRVEEIFAQYQIQA